MGNGNGSGAVRGLAKRLSSANGREVVVLTAEMRKKMGNLLVVATRNGNTLVLNGGQHVKSKNGAELTTEEFNRRFLPGMHCIYNPRFTLDGSLDLNTARLR